jgi:hypothetical protein
MAAPTPAGEACNAGKDDRLLAPLHCKRHFPNHPTTLTCGRHVLGSTCRARACSAHRAAGVRGRRRGSQRSATATCTEVMRGRADRTRRPTAASASVRTAAARACSLAVAEDTGEVVLLLPLLLLLLLLVVVVVAVAAVLAGGCCATMRNTCRRRCSCSCCGLSPAAWGPPPAASEPSAAAVPGGTGASSTAAAAAAAVGPKQAGSSSAGLRWRLPGRLRRLTLMWPCCFRLASLTNRHRDTLGGRGWGAPSAAVASCSSCSTLLVAAAASFHARRTCCCSCAAKGSAARWRSCCCDVLLLLSLLEGNSWLSAAPDTAAAAVPQSGLTPACCCTANCPYSSTDKFKTTSGTAGLPPVMCFLTCAAGAGGQAC